MDDILSATDAGVIASRARKLLAKGLLTHRQYALLDTLLWSCRAPGKATAHVSYSILQERAHQARSTVAAGLEVLPDPAHPKSHPDHRPKWRAHVEAAHQCLPADRVLRTGVRWAN